MKKVFFLIAMVLISNEIFATDLYVNKVNSVSNVEFYNSNYGLFGQNISSNAAGLFWPRNSNNSYVFGGGIWFGTIKLNPNNGEYEKYCFVTYDPNNGQSWAAPGSIDEGDSLRTDLANKNNLYISTDYNADGTIETGKNGAPWPLWITNTNSRNELNNYQYNFVLDTNSRNSTNYPLGPLFVSDEDMYSRFKDTELRYYTGGAYKYQQKGYPLGLQFEQSVYTWNTDDLNDIIILTYVVENKSEDTLYSCFVAPMADIDIVGDYTVDPFSKTSNDRFKYWDKNEELNLCVMWSEPNSGDEGKGLGYMGISFIETPAVTEGGFLRTDKEIYAPNEQLGLKTCKNWNIEEDMKIDEARYDAISSLVKDGDYGAGDKRFLMATGPFNLLPNEKVRLSYAITFAMPAKGAEADGTVEDIMGLDVTGKVSTLQGNTKSLVQKLNNVRSKYYQALNLSVGDNQVTNINIDGVYPNPATKMLTIEYNQKNSGNVSVGLYNQLGEEVQNFYKGWQSGGKQSNQYQLNTKELSAGIYFIRIQSENEVKTKAISIIK